MFAILISCVLKLQTIIKAMEKLKPALKRHIYLFRHLYLYIRLGGTYAWALKFTPFHQLLVAKEVLCEPNIGWN